MDIFTWLVSGFPGRTASVPKDWNEGGGGGAPPVSRLEFSRSRVGTARTACVLSLLVVGFGASVSYFTSRSAHLLQKAIFSARPDPTSH